MFNKAIDIVILPPSEIADRCIAHNKISYAKNLAARPLGTDDYFPHISLLMGVMDTEKQAALFAVLEKITHHTNAFLATITHHSGSWLNLENNATLQKLQQTILREIDPLLSHNASADMFVADPDEIINPDCFPWINNVETSFGANNFKPHITVGELAPEPNVLPLTFTASRLAICQLGNYNTCRKILFETILNNDT